MANHKSARDGSPEEASPPGGEDVLALREAEQVVEALNEAIAHEGPPSEKARFLMRRLQQMLEGDCDIELFLHADLLRHPSPRLLERIFIGPTFQRIEPRPHSEVQSVFDESGPAMQQIVPDALQNLRSPRTFLLSEDIADRKWFEAVREKRLRPYGWKDVLAGNWAASKDRLVVLAVLLRIDQPTPGPETRRLLSLMLRAIAPIVDREMFEDVDGRRAGEEQAGAENLLEGRDLSQRQADVLHLLLRGMSEKEVARELGVSTHTVHTHVRKLYAQFGVNSRGELLAKFVDQRVLKLRG
jgi:DNA-binding CsgD family transcriptional regulator